MNKCKTVVIQFPWLQVCGIEIPVDLLIKGSSGMQAEAQAITITTLFALCTFFCLEIVFSYGTENILQPLDFKRFDLFVTLSFHFITEFFKKLNPKSDSRLVGSNGLSLT